MKFYIAAFFFFSHYIFCNAQGITEQSSEPVEINCIYKLTFKTDSSSNVFHFDNQLLQIARNFSKYESKGQIMADSLLNSFSTMPFNQSSANFYMQQRSKLPAYRTTFKIYKLRQSKIIRFYDRISINDFFYDESDNLFKWTILSDKKNILGYSCQKAVTAFAGRIWDVWFTRQIPISDGPYKFQGLPGLILKAEDTKNNFIFEITSLSKATNQLILTLPSASSARKTTKYELRRGREANRKSGFSQLTSSGELSVKNPEQIQRQQSAKVYNPIELK